MACPRYVLAHSIPTTDNLTYHTKSGYERHEIFLGVQSHIYCIDYHPTTFFLAAGVGPAVYVTREVSQSEWANRDLPLIT